MNDFYSDNALVDAINNGELTPSPQMLALLQELQNMLSALAQGNQANSVDIRSLPLTPADHDFLIQFLGSGEVSATVNALGLSEINETRFSGIWLITHYNHHEEIIADLIEVTPLPDILKTQAEDIRQGNDTLRRYLQKLQTHD